MHRSTMLRMEWFVNNYIKEDNKRVLDVGSYSVNGSYRDLFRDKKVEYVGLDIEAGPNVDIVMDEPYAWTSIPDESFDYIISGQAFEHIEYPWLTIKEIFKKLKPGGVICIIAPNSTPEHRYPFDCYRYFSDGLSALAKWAGFEVLDITVAGIPARSVSPEWYSGHNDVCLIAMKPKEGFRLADVPKMQYERRLNWFADLKLSTEFLANWIEKPEMKDLLIKFVKQKTPKQIYIYGKNAIGRIVCETLMESIDVPIVMIGPKSTEPCDVDPGIEMSDIGQLEEDAMMFITLFDNCRDFKCYLKSLYKTMPIYYADEVLDMEIFHMFFEKHTNIYLYGAGVYGRKYLEILKRFGLQPKGFVVSDGNKVKEEEDSYKIYELSEIACDDTTGIIVSVSDKWQKDIEAVLKKAGFNNYIMGCNYMGVVVE